MLDEEVLHSGFLPFAGTRRSSQRNPGLADTFHATDIFGSHGEKSLSLPDGRSRHGIPSELLPDRFDDRQLILEDSPLVVLV